MDTNRIIADIDTEISKLQQAKKHCYRMSQQRKVQAGVQIDQP